MAIPDPNRKSATHELASGDVLFAATGVTDGSLLSGVRYKKSAVRTATVSGSESVASDTISATGNIPRVRPNRS